MIFIAPETVNYTEKNCNTTKPCYSNNTLPIPWPFITSKSHCGLTLLLEIYLKFVMVISQTGFKGTFI